jgi:hypothetical protein
LFGQRITATPRNIDRRPTVDAQTTAVASIADATKNANLTTPRPGRAVNQPSIDQGTPARQLKPCRSAVEATDDDIRVANLRQTDSMNQFPRSLLHT